MTASILFACLMCFVAGACLAILALVAVNRPPRKVIWCWMAYLTLVMALAWRFGGAIL